MKSSKDFRAFLSNVKKKRKRKQNGRGKKQTGLGRKKRRKSRKQRGNVKKRKKVLSTTKGIAKNSQLGVYLDRMQ